MDTEIERKWLIEKQNIPYDLNRFEFKEIEQAYLLHKPTLRIRKENDDFYLTYKEKIKQESDNTSIERFEKNTAISKDDYYRLLASKDGILIKKRRYLIPYMQYTIELDVFKEEYNGLIYAEIEFPTKDEALNFQSLDWFSKELTYDPLYNNSSLAKGSLL